MIKDYSNIKKTILLEDSVVFFYFKDGTKVKIECDPKLGIGFIEYTGNRTKQSYKFITELIAICRPEESNFWFIVTSILHDFTTYIYEL